MIPNKSNTEKARFWQERITEQKHSGQSIVKFCRENSLNRHTFGYWKMRLNAHQKEKRFLPVKVPGTQIQICTRVILPNGVVFELGDDVARVEINDLIKTLCGVQDVASQ